MPQRQKLSVRFPAVKRIKVAKMKKIVNLAANKSMQMSVWSSSSFSIQVMLKLSLANVSSRSKVKFSVEGKMSFTEMLVDIELIMALSVEKTGKVSTVVFLRAEVVKGGKVESSI